MKRVLYILVFLSTLSSLGQNLESLKIRAKKVHDSNYNMDFEPLSELTYPSVVEEFGGHDKFIAKLDADYQNQEFRKRIQIENPVFKYSNIKKIEGKSYCVISYYNPIRYFFEKKLDAVSGPIKAAELKAIEQATLTVFEPIRNTINVKRNSKFIAIADETTNNEWRFINFDDVTQRELAQKLLNESIKKEIGL